MNDRGEVLVNADLQRGGANGASVLRTFFSLYSSWKTLLTNGIFFAAYYLLFYELIIRSNAGFFLITVPFPLLVVFVLASSALATVVVTYLRLSLALRRRSIPGAAQSPIGLAVGAFVASCSCNLPVLAPMLYFVGLNAVEVSGVISFLAAYQQAIVEAIVVFDVVSIYYYVRQLSRNGFGRP